MWSASGFDQDEEIECRAPAGAAHARSSGTDCRSVTKITALKAGTERRLAACFGSRMLWLDDWRDRRKRPGRSDPQSRRISRYAWKALAGSAMDEFDLLILGFMHFINSVCQRAQPSICIVVSCGDNIYSCNAECLFRRYCDPFAPSSLVHYGEVNRFTDLSKIIDELFIRYVATRDRRSHTRLNGRATGVSILFDRRLENLRKKKSILPVNRNGNPHRIVKLRARECKVDQIPGTAYLYGAGGSFVKPLAVAKPIKVIDAVGTLARHHSKYRPLRRRLLPASRHPAICKARRVQAPYHDRSAPVCHRRRIASVQRPARRGSH
jgi:hypothetical protein